MRYALFVAAALTLSTAASAADSGPIIAYPPQNDTVTLSLNVEDWVQTQTARTEIAIDAALPGSDAGKVRAQMQSAVKGLIQGAEWRFTSFDRNDDSSGLERWHAVLEARLPEAQLGGLSDRAKQASKPGLQITVQAVDFTPTLAEFEAVRTKLRGDLYKRVNESLTQLNQAEPDRKFRISRIDFGGAGPRSYDKVQAAPMALARRAAAAEAPAESIERSEKIQLNAVATFAALAPRE